MMRICTKTDETKHILNYKKHFFEYFLLLRYHFHASVLIHGIEEALQQSSVHLLPFYRFQPIKQCFYDSRYLVRSNVNVLEQLSKTSALFVKTFWQSYQETRYLG